MTRRFHIALGVADIASSVEDYSERLQAQPALVVPHAYALWRTPSLNFSIRQVEPHQVGQLRHLGWEDPNATGFSQEQDGNGIHWEHFALAHQLEEIALAWPEQVKPHHRI